MKTVTGAYRRLFAALLMLIAIGIQLSGGMCIPDVGLRPVATADWQGIEGRSLPDVVDGGSVVSHLSSRDRSRPLIGKGLRAWHCQELLMAEAWCRISAVATGRDPTGVRTTLANRSATVAASAISTTSQMSGGMCIPVVGSRAYSVGVVCLWMSERW